MSLNEIKKSKVRSKRSLNSLRFEVVSVSISSNPSSIDSEIISAKLPINTEKKAALVVNLIILPLERVL